MPEDRHSGSDYFRVERHTAAAELLAQVEQAYVLHYRDVYRYVLALTRSADDAEEITSETFERAMRAWDTAPDAVVPWLLLVARRIYVDRWRRTTRWARTLLHPVRASGEGSDQSRTEFWLWFEAVTRILTPRQREALVLRYQRDLSDADIAYVMGITESGVRSLVARGLEVLRKHEELWQ